MTESFTEDDRSGIKKINVEPIIPPQGIDYWAKRAHDRGELSLELRQRFYECLGGDRVGRSKEESHDY